MSELTVWNVRAAVVMLVEAATPGEAMRKARKEIDRCGLVPLDDDPHADVFQSEDGVEADVR